MSEIKQAERAIEMVALFSGATDAQVAKAKAFHRLAVASHDVFHALCDEAVADDVAGTVTLDMERAAELLTALGEAIKGVEDEGCPHCGLRDDKHDEFCVVKTERDDAGRDEAERSMAQHCQAVDPDDEQRTRRSLALVAALESHGLPYEVRGRGRSVVVVVRGRDVHIVIRNAADVDAYVVYCWQQDAPKLRTSDADAVVALLLEMGGVL
jgi:hypothetical protein